MTNKEMLVYLVFFPGNDGPIAAFRSKVKTEKYLLNKKQELAEQYGYEINLWIEPIVIRDGLSKETIEAIKDDIRKSYCTATAFKPRLKESHND